MKTLVLNKELFTQLKEAHHLLVEDRIVSNSYFPFYVCFPYVLANGEPVTQIIENLRSAVCEAYNRYVSEIGSLVDVIEKLQSLLVVLEATEGFWNGEIKQ